MEVRLQVTNEKANAKQVRLGAETVIGRSSECNLRIASGQVSRQHCIIRVEESRVLVRDLGSANGTEVDGVTIPPEVDIPVAPGSVLVVGPLKFVFEYTPDPPKEGEMSDDLQSTTHDIPPIPSNRVPPVDDEDTKDYGPSLSRQRQSLRADEPDSGQIDFSEGEPGSPVAVVGGNPGGAPGGPPFVAADETVFDRNLANRPEDELISSLTANRRLETGTDLLPEGDGSCTPGSTTVGGFPVGQSATDPDTDEGNADESLDGDASDSAEATTQKGWKVFGLLQRGRKRGAAESRPSDVSGEKPVADPPLAPIDPASPPTAPASEDSALQDFLRRFDP